MNQGFLGTQLGGDSAGAPTPSPFRLATYVPTTLHHNLKHQHDAISELFDNVNEMTVIGKVGEEDEETAVWVYHINVIRGPVEFVAIVFTVLTVLLMMNQIGLHLEYNTHKGFRIYTIRILFMVPVYSITSYAGLHNPSNAIIWAMIRDMYECVVLASFLQYCLTYLGGPENLARYLMAKQLSDTAVPNIVESPRKKPKKSFFSDSDSDSDSVSSPRASHKQKPKKKQTHANHPRLCWLFCPCCPIWRPLQGSFTRPWQLGAEFVRLSLIGTLQYIPFSILVTVAGVIGKMYGVYHDGRFTFDDVYLYTIIVRNWSQCWALYCLGLFYVTLHDELEDMRPVLKFSVIKLVVLFMWWQGVFVNLLEQSEGMKAADDGLLQRGWTTKEVGFCIQNFLCIIEMFFIAIGMHYAFHYTEWATEEVAAAHKNTSPWTAFFRSKVVNTVKDVLHDVNSVKNTVKNTVTKTDRQLDVEAGEGRKTKKRPKFKTISRLLTKKERTAAKRLFTEGVNFSDIFISLREINMLEKSLRREGLEEVRLVEEGSEGEDGDAEKSDDDVELTKKRSTAKGGKKTNTKKALTVKVPEEERPLASYEDFEDEYEDVMGEYDASTGLQAHTPPGKEVEDKGYSPSFSEVRRMAAHVKQSMEREGTTDLLETKSKSWDVNAKSPINIEKGDEGAMFTVRPASGDPLSVRSGEHDSVAKFKERVADHIGFPVNRIQLMVKGKPLNDALVMAVLPSGEVVDLALIAPKKKGKTNSK